MSFGTNLQFLRTILHHMTQEELAEKLAVSRQTISKWEQDGVWPEMEKLLTLCEFFSCSLDQLVREDMNSCGEYLSNIRKEIVPPLRYLPYTVISIDPETDAINRCENMAKELAIEEPQIIGWDFPNVSQEQVNVHHMHGYTAALILPEGIHVNDLPSGVKTQPARPYIAITIQEPFQAPFELIPHAYQTLMIYMQTNGIAHLEDKAVISCFEKEYVRDDTKYMDVYIAVKN